ncbi:hypothetical protein FRC01_003501 [Tulasnella sp. 417]|nr:hypothetical protein FRC01_003501 [Tulasnella sp. 417]
MDDQYVFVCATKWGPIDPAQSIRSPTALNPTMVVWCSDLTEHRSSSTAPQTDPPSVPHIHNLPIELLAQILLLSLTGGAWERYWELFGMASITRLRSVCVRWNRTILKEPAFWTHIDEDDVIKAPSAVENKVRRSGVLPLTIQYHNWGDVSGLGEEPSESPEFYKFIELISRHTDRWKSLSIYGLDYELNEVECLEKQHFPVLEDLEIRRGCSSLHTLAVLKVEGEILALDVLVEILQGLENLEELVLSDLQFDDYDVESQMDIGWPDESHPTSLPQLKKIRITSFESTPAVACVLKCIHTPKITDVVILEDQGNEAQGEREIIRALTLHIGRQSTLTSMLCVASKGAPLELGGVGEHMSMELNDPINGLYVRVNLSLSEEDWDETLVMLAAVRSEEELAALRKKVAKLKCSRTEFNHEETRRCGGSDSNGYLEVVTVLVDGTEL